MGSALVVAGWESGLRLYGMYRTCAAVPVFSPCQLHAGPHRDP